MSEAIRSASVEFLKFLADISHPVTGKIDLDAFAMRIGVSREVLIQKWQTRGGKLDWDAFADEVLAVLDAAYDLTSDLPKTIDWYRHQPLKAFDMKTAESVVGEGGARLLKQALKGGEVSIQG